MVCDFSRAKTTTTINTTLLTHGLSSNCAISTTTSHSLNDPTSKCRCTKTWKLARAWKRLKPLIRTKEARAKCRMLLTVYPTVAVSSASVKKEPFPFNGSWTGKKLLDIRYVVLTIIQILI